jgi:hypothetical protein
LTIGLKIRRLIQKQGVLGIKRLRIALSADELRGIVKMVSFKTTGQTQAT